ncbi:MAG TPA: hypothetical protein VHB27_20470 [Rhodopila sp.]|uniref:NUDIX hydrolase n=1 Tax=Rhodopila sp. TaxID=2480087 RepID=UPI002B86168C|nr:hypothetical protein [Rhodopila sp.]HVY17605.1 hypothetical protein [Rhodopila sp.]
MRQPATALRADDRNESANRVAAELIAVVVAVTRGEPRVLTIGGTSALPSGPFQTTHRSLQSGLRSWVEEQTHHALGYVEQLYTFADSDRTQDGSHRISISYLGLTRETAQPGVAGNAWRNWYEFFPWEDHRNGEPAIIRDDLLPRLTAWAAGKGEAAEQRVAITFGAWNEELVLQRYELLYEAGLVPEACRDGMAAGQQDTTPGRPMVLDHRRILATGIARLRAKIKYRPVVFELMADSFTLGQLQRTVEAIAGRGVHKQNFRRLIEQQELVEETGETTQATGGRPAKLVRFRRSVLAERGVTGSKLPLPPG